MSTATTLPPPVPNYETVRREMADWPLPLRLSAVRDTLAQQIYWGAREAYGDPRDWHADLSHEERENYRRIALAVLEGVKPGAERGSVPTSPVTPPDGAPPAGRVITRLLALGIGLRARIEPIDGYRNGMGGGA